MVVLKRLLLAEYQLEVSGASKAIVGILVLAKAVVVLEHVSFGTWVRRQPAWVDVVLRTALYALGVAIVLALERAIEGRSESGGLWRSLVAAWQGTDAHHVAVNVYCVSGALLVYNPLAVVRRNLGDRRLRHMLLRPIPSEGSPPGWLGSSKDGPIWAAAVRGPLAGQFRGRCARFVTFDFAEVRFAPVRGAGGFASPCATA